MKTITTQKLVEIMLDSEKSGINGASFIGIDTVTKPTLKGGMSNEMKDCIVKRNIGSSVMIFQNKKSNGYENMVKKRLLSENKNVNFELGNRTWGERIKNTCIVEHKGKRYLEVIFLKSGKVSYEYNGKKIDKEKVIGLNDYVSSNGQGGLQEKVIIRTFCIENIVGIRINKQEFEVVQ